MLIVIDTMPEQNWTWPRQDYCQYLLEAWIRLFKPLLLTPFTN